MNTTLKTAIAEVKTEEQYREFLVNMNFTDFIESTIDVLALTNFIIDPQSQGLEIPGTNTNPSFYSGNANLLLSSIILYLMKHCSRKDRTMQSVMKLLKASQIDESNKREREAMSTLDMLFKFEEFKGQMSLAIKQYQLYSALPRKYRCEALATCINSLFFVDNYISQECLGLPKS